MIREYRQQFELLRKVHFFIALCAILIASSGWAVAQPKGDVLSNTLYVYKIVTENGKEKKVPTETIGGGDTLQYEVVLKNTSSTTLKGVAASLPIEKGLELIPNTVQPTTFKASTDGKVFASYPLRRRVRADGQEKIVPVPHSEYRFLRWSPVDLAPGQSATFRARIRLAR